MLITTEFFLPFICGVTTAVLNERKALSELGHEVRILTIGDSRRSVYDDGVYFIKKNIPQLYKDSYATLAFSDPLIEEIYEWSPNIVHAQSEFFTMIFAKKIARKCHIPMILTCHTDYPAYGVHFVKNKTIWNKVVETYVPKLIRAANVVLCSSSKIERLLRSYDIKNPILGIHLGFDFSEFKQELEVDDKRCLLEQFKLTEAGCIFISICRLSKEKSIDLCIDIFSQINEKSKGTRFLIVGDGDDRERLEKIVIDKGLSGAVIFVGAISHEEIWKYYKIGDIFLNASLSETQGLTFLESIASGVPVVCRKDPVLSNFLEDGVNGYSYENPSDCVNICLNLVSNKGRLDQLKESCSKTIESFSLDVFGKNLERLFLIAIEEQWQIDNPIPENSSALEEFGTSAAK